MHQGECNIARFCSIPRQLIRYSNTIQSSVVNIARAFPHTQNNRKAKGLDPMSGLWICFDGGPSLVVGIGPKTWFLCVFKFSDGFACSAGDRAETFGFFCYFGFSNGFACSGGHRVCAVGASQERTL